MNVPRESIEEPRPFCVRESYPHSWHQRRVKDHSSDLISCCQVYGGHCPYALAIQNNVFRADAVPGTKSQPCCIDIRVEIFLRWFSWTCTITRIVITENIAIDSTPETNVKTGHLAQINGISVTEENGVFGVRGTTNKSAGNSISSGRTSLKDLYTV